MDILDDICEGIPSYSLIPHPDNCFQFVICMSGMAILQTCPSYIPVFNNETCVEGDPNTCEIYLNPTTPSSTTKLTTTTSTQTTKSQTLPPSCIDGNLDNRVCELEETIEGMLKENEEMREHFESQIEALVEENKEQRSSAAAALEDLQNQILILSSRPCSCR